MLPKHLERFNRMAQEAAEAERIQVVKDARRARLLRAARTAALVIFGLLLVTLGAFIPRPMELPQAGVPVLAWTKSGNIHLAVVDSNGKFFDASSWEAIQQVVRWREP